MVLPNGACRNSRWLNSPGKRPITLRMMRNVKTRWRYIPPLAMIVLGIGLSVLAFLMVRHREYREVQLTFEEDAAERFDSLKREIEFDLQTLEAITAFYQASRGVERSEFRSFAKPLLDRHQSIQALEWIPRVPLLSGRPTKRQQNETDSPAFRSRKGRPRDGW